MKILKKLRPVLGIFSLFFVILMVILFVGEKYVIENEGNINYALGINPYEQITDNDGSIDTEYFKSDFYKSDGETYDDVAMRNHSMDVSRKANGEGMVLLWNKNDALPLKEGSKLSMFGVSSQSANWLYTGAGSGKVTVTTSDFLNLKDTFELEGKYTVNSKLYAWYKNLAANAILSGLSHANADGTNYKADPHYREFRVGEKEWAGLYSDVGSTFSSYGDAAIFFISRNGNEDGDTWFDTSANTGQNHIENNYLDLTQNEVDTIEALVDLKKDGVFKSVILVLNTGTPMAMKNITSYDIDACLWAGMGGNASFGAIYDVMSGAVNPSGKLVDTYAYDSDSAPSTVNTGAYEFYGDTAGLPDDARSNNSYNHAYIVYQEGIYVGYRYYETRYEDVVMNKGNAASSAGVKCSQNNTWNYSQEVAFPFGYGESYTDFAYSDFSVKSSGDTYEVSVTVTNTGDVAGKTPVQIYLQKPYTEYDKEVGIEKASVELVGFTKTDLLQPDQSETYTIPVKAEEFKTYDANGHKTYILEKGDYYLATGSDAHDALNNILAAKGYDKGDGMVDSLGNSADGNRQFANKITVSSDDFTKYSKSTVTDYAITNQFDDADINKYEGTENMEVTYLSRSDWQGTYPQSFYKMTLASDKFIADMQYSTGIEEDPEAEMPTYGTITSDFGRLSLIQLKDLPFDAPMWDDLLNQLTWYDTVRLCGIGSHEITGITYDEATNPTGINSPRVVAHDGPAGVKNSKPKDVHTFMAFPNGVLLASTWNEEVVEEVYDAFGMEMLHAGVGEIYGTCAGLHRSVYGGRNWESFSEDGFMSGRILCAEVKGLQGRGAIVNIKHFVLNDQEIYRCGTATWANEQSIREIYMKAYEAAVTEAKANGVMSSLNRIGTTWAGRHYGLLTEVLRNEWGFEGLVETDAAHKNSYAGRGDARAEAILAGNDLWLAGTEEESLLWGDYTENATVAQGLRESAHRILYVVLHSAAMNGIDSSTRIVYVQPWYFDALYTAQIAVTVVTVVIVLAFACSIALPIVFGRKRKNEGDSAR